MKNDVGKIAIIGLGYIGLPLAVGLSKKYDVIGFDTGGSEKMRLTAQSFGELLVATTDGSPWNNNNSDPL